ncbi:MAG TPA: hypothetical protein VHE61_00380 [Opitutaceae bacterium]|nr:hypothetical protein [Opitutaceae bacterium]
MPKRKLPWADSERELAKIRARISRIEAEVARATQAAARREQRSVEKPAAPRPGLSRSGGARPATSAPSPVAKATAPAPQETWPAGTDLNEPKSFGQRPPVGDLEQGNLSVEDQRRRLTQHLAFTTRVLHTSGVVAIVWREWRAFERSLEEALRKLNAAPPAV